MSRRHRIGGSKARGFAAISRKRRTEIATMGGHACCAKHGSAHMAKIGAIGGAGGNTKH